MPPSKLLSLVMLLGVLAGCNNSSPQNQSAVKVGVLLPLTGDFRYFGDIARKSIQSQQDLHSISLIFEDSACDAKKALSSYRKLSELDGVRLYLGPCCGNELESVAPLLPVEDKLMLSLCSSTGGLFERSKGRLLSPVFSIEAESQFMARHIESKNFSRIGIVYFNNAFSVAHEAAFRGALVKATAATHTFDKMDPEAVRDISLKFLKEPPDAIYVPDLTPFLLSFAKQMNKVGLGNIPIFSIHATQTEDIFAAEGSFANGIIYSHPDTGDESADSYYPRIAAHMANDAITQCGDNIACSKDYLIKKYPFSADGTMRGTLVLRTIKDGKFIPLTSTDSR